jgi:hypothetical protein
MLLLAVVPLAYSLAHNNYSTMSLGFLTESALMPSKGKKIQVDYLLEVPASTQQ